MTTLPLSYHKPSLFHLSEGNVVQGTHPNLKCNGEGLFGDCTEVHGEAAVNLVGDITGCIGNISHLYGNISAISGNVSSLEGEVTYLRGNATGLRGDIRGRYGNLDAIPEAERLAKPHLKDWTS